MTFGSLFSGVGGIDLGMERAGWRCAWQVEAKAFRRAVLATHWPGVKRYDDIQTVGGKELAPVDCITAGVPCQDVSIAGRRAGLKGARTKLFFDFARILEEIRPAWFVFENVPGLLSSNQGRDFAVVQYVLMGKCGYGVSWRILNSQFFGVAQRRRRLFIVGRFGKPCPAEVLFEPPGGGWDIEAGGEEGPKIAATITGGTGRIGSRGGEEGPILLPQPSRKRSDLRGGMRDGQENFIVRQAISAHYAKHGAGGAGDGEWNNLVTAPLTAGSHPNSSAPGRRREDDYNLVIPPLRGSGAGTARSGGPKLHAEDEFCIPHPVRSDPGDQPGKQIESPTGRPGPDAGEGRPAARGDTAYSLRRDPGTFQAQNANLVVAKPILTQEGKQSHAPENNYVSAPVDADRVRSFAGLPEGLDSPRYEALGDAVTVAVAEWIGRRILKTAPRGQSWRV